jgi:hypothetical protein
MVKETIDAKAFGGRLKISEKTVRERTKFVNCGDGGINLEVGSARKLFVSGTRNSSRKTWKLDQRENCS